MVAFGTRQTAHNKIVDEIAFLNTPLGGVRD